MPHKRKLVLIGWDAADWHLAHPLMDAGKMPHLSRLVESGMSGDIRTLTPALSPMLWTSIATGRHAADHGILGFMEPDPVTGAVRASSSTSRRVPAIWNMLDRHGYAASCVNWFASHPAEAGRGMIVSNAVASIASNLMEPPAQLPPGSVFPPEQTQEILDLTVMPTDLSGNDLALFIPDLAKVDQEKDKRPLELAKVLANNITTHAAATWILEHTEWDFLGVYYDLIDRAGHHFMPYHGEVMKGTTAEDFEIYQHVMNGVYQYHDLMLGRVLQLAGPDATIMLLSDHGFLTGAARPPKDAGPETWHRDHGVICVAGPGIRRDELVFGATLMDVAPTLLALYGLPASEQMPGRVLTEIFTEPPQLTRIPSWETGLTDQRSATEALGQAWDAAEMMDQLAALGYVDNRTDDQKTKAERTRNDQSFNLSRALLSTGRAEEAIPLLQELLAGKPDSRDHQLLLGLAYLRSGRLAECREVAGRVAEGEADRPLASLLLAEIDIREGNGVAALQRVNEVERTGLEGGHTLYGRAGRALLLMGRWAEAEKRFRAAISHWPEQAPLHRGLASALEKQNRYREAAEAALESVGLDYASPAGHFLLGMCLARLGYRERAGQALEVCLRFAPGHKRAQAWLDAVRQTAAAAAAPTVES